MFIILPTRSNPEANKLILLLVIFGFFIASMVVSCNEVRYTVGGRTQDAAVEKMLKITHVGDTDNSDARIRVHYTVLESGDEKRSESDEVSLDWMEKNRDKLLNDDENGRQTIAVQFLAGSEGHSRLVGHTSRWVMIPFALAIIFLTIVTVRFWKDFNEHQRRMAAERD